MYVFGCMCIRLPRKHNILRTVHFKLGTGIGFDPYICPIFFGDDVMHINNGAALCTNFDLCIS